jgi:hypothetical protein
MNTDETRINSFIPGEPAPTIQVSIPPRLTHGFIGDYPCRSVANLGFEV